MRAMQREGGKKGGMDGAKDIVNLPGIFVLDVLDRASALNTTDGKAGRVGKAAHYPRLPLERAL